MAGRIWNVCGKCTIVREAPGNLTCKIVAVFRCQTCQQAYRQTMRNWSADMRESNRRFREAGKAFAARVDAQQKASALRPIERGAA